MGDEGAEDLLEQMDQALANMLPTQGSEHQSHGQYCI